MYQAGFWRLLQAPYYKNLIEVPALYDRPITGETVIADLIETYGDAADRIMRRYGLYCEGNGTLNSDYPAHAKLVTPRNRS